jgi:transposase
MPRGGRARGQPVGRDHRQPERPGGAKRGARVDPQGCDTGKKVTGRKRHIMVGTLGLMVGITVHPANVQDRDEAAEVLRQTRRSFPFIEVTFADAGYQGPRMAETVANTGKWRIEIVKRKDVPRFKVVPKHWIVERTLAWINHFRRLARDFERHARIVAAFIRLAMIRIMLRRLTRSAWIPTFRSGSSPSAAPGSGRIPSSD